MAERQILVSLRLGDVQAVRSLGELEAQLVRTRQKLNDAKKEVKALDKGLADGNLTAKEYKAANEILATSMGRLKSEAKSLSSNITELSNDTAGLTSAGVRFRDKMAAASLEALRQSGIIGKLDAQYASLKGEYDANINAIRRNEDALKGLNAEYKKGEYTTKEYRDEKKRLNAELETMRQQNKKLESSITEVSGAIAKVDKRVEDLTADLKAGRITAEQFRAGVDQINKSINDNSAAFKNGLNSLKAYALGYLGIQEGIAIVKDAVGTIADFGKGLSAIKALGGEYAQSIDAIAEATKTAGIEFGFTAQQSLGAVEALAKAGVSAEQILGGGLTGALTLATAGELEVGEAAEIAALAMAQFGLDGTQVSHVADLLAAGAASAQGEVSDMAYALKQSGLVASQFGLSVEETAATLTAFAEAGLLGSDAGTSFRTMLLRLAKPSEEAAATMESIGIAAYDSTGAFVGIEKLAGQLQDRLKGLTAEQRQSALTTIFGTDAIRAATVLYEQGATGIAEWTDKVNQSGFAAKVAAEQTNNLRGDIDRLTASYDALVLSGGAVDTVLRSITQSATRMVDRLNEGLSEDASWMDRLEGLRATNLGLIGVINSFIENSNDQERALERVGKRAKDSGEELGRVAKSTTEATEAQKAQVAAEAAAKEAASKTVKGLRDRLKELKDQRDALDVTDKEGLATNAAAIMAVEKQIKALDAQTESTKRAKTAREELTQAQKDAIISANDISADVQTNVLAIDPNTVANTDTSAVMRMPEEQAIWDQNAENYANDAKAFAEAQQIKIDQLNAFSDALVGLSDLLGSENEAGKALATAAALVNTYLGATLALTDKTIPNAFARIAAATAVIASGLASVRKIQGFEEGGYTPKKSSDKKEVGVVHANEWVAPAWMNRSSKYGPIIRELEQARRARGMRSGMDGFYDGGSTYTYVLTKKRTGIAPAPNPGGVAQADLTRALLNMPPPQLDLTEMARAQRRVAYTERASNLR